MRRRQSGGYLAFVIFFLIINVAPAIYRMFTQNSDGLGALFDLGNIVRYLGGGAIIAVVLYFAWAQISPSAWSIDSDDD